mgnify:CR=1 FL=1
MDDFHNIRNVEVADLSHQSYLHDVDNFSKKMLESLKIPKERLGQSQRSTQSDMLPYGLREDLTEIADNSKLCWRITSNCTGEIIR